MKKNLIIKVMVSKTRSLEDVISMESFDYCLEDSKIDDCQRFTKIALHINDVIDGNNQIWDKYLFKKKRERKQNLAIINLYFKAKKPIRDRDLFLVRVYHKNQ